MLVTGAERHDGIYTDTWYRDMYDEVEDYSTECTKGGGEPGRRRRVRNTHLMLHSSLLL